MKKYNLELKDKIPVLVCEEEYAYNGVANAPDKIVKMMNSIFRLNKKAEEYVYMLTCNTKFDVTGIFEISHGISNQSLVGMREILIRALLSGGSSIILVHNHPSGDTKPSSLDFQITEEVKKGASMVGITLIDHIIIGEQDNFTSIKEMGYL